MNNKQSIYTLIAAAIAVVISAILLNSCSSLRHYNKVAKDEFRNEQERAILAPVCLKEFPVKTTKQETKIDTVVHEDTTAINTLKKVIKQLQKQLQQQPECPQIDVDSLVAVIQQGSKPITKEIRYYTKETVVDSAYMAIAQKRFEDLQKYAQRQLDSILTAKQKIENDFHKEKLRADKLEAGTKNNVQLAKWFLKHNWWWMLILLSAFIGFKYLQTKFTLPFKILNKLK